MSTEIYIIMEVKHKNEILIPHSNQKYNQAVTLQRHGK